jgi:hypothetical protein
MTINRRLPIFVATFVAAVATFMVWWLWVGTDGHWGPYCSSPDFCSGWPEMGGAFKVSLVFATITAAEVVALVTPGRPRTIGLAMLPLLAFAVIFFLVPEIRSFLFP